tara:strand:+ start:4967 stop:5149 length:183 start_codon:yes stop_codon:yes gene_type:complete
MYRTLLIILSILIILTPFSGIPGGVEDALIQLFAAAVLLLVLLLPKPESKKEVIEENHDF